MKYNSKSLGGRVKRSNPMVSTVKYDVSKMFLHKAIGTHFKNVMYAGRIILT